MASVNPLSRELVFKIVYYGPGLGGKTTTLEYLHRTTKPEHRGKLVSLATPVDRTLYFDFLPVRLPPVRGMNVRLQLFTVPGQVYFNATRKLVLTGADGIVFVSDSQAGRADANLESLENLRENLAEQGRELSQIPLIFQHNKRDLPDLLSLEELDEMLNPFDAISVPASARTGMGIFEGLELISERVLRAFEQRLPEEVSTFGATFDAVEGGLVTALRDASPQLAFEPTVSRVSPPVGSWSSMPPHATLEEPTSEELASELSSQLSAAQTLIPEGESGVPPPSGLEGAAISQLNRAQPADVDPEVAQADELPAITLPRRAPAHPRGGVSFAALWPLGERDLCASVEDAIASGQHAHAVIRCDDLLTRLLANAADLLGSPDAPRDAAVIPLLLGLDGRRYLSFRSLVLKARAGGEISQREALTAYAFAVSARVSEMSL